MDKFEENKLTAEDFGLKDEDLDNAAGGVVEELKVPCPLCGKYTLVRVTREIACTSKRCTFRHVFGRG